MHTMTAPRLMNPRTRRYWLSDNALTLSVLALIASLAFNFWAWAGATQLDRPGQALLEMAGRQPSLTSVYIVGGHSMKSVMPGLASATQFARLAFGDENLAHMRNHPTLALSRVQSAAQTWCHQLMLYMQWAPFVLLVLCIWFNYRKPKQIKLGQR